MIEVPLEGIPAEAPLMVYINGLLMRQNADYRRSATGVELKHSVKDGDFLTAVDLDSRQLLDLTCSYYEPTGWKLVRAERW